MALLMLNTRITIRGRGPEVRGQYRFDARGFPNVVELSGHDYYKAPVDEHLTVIDGEAR